ncbi:MAG: TonB-dependent receptor [Chlorobi bacterium]|nr:TonB-dependent receptor [Chlorobiota bacterium]
MKPDIKKLLAGLLVLMSFTAGAQQCRLKLVDKINNEPIAYANVLVTSLDGKKVSGYVSDIDGNVIFEIDDKSTLDITYIGFQDISDTISPGEKKKIFLESISYNVNEVVVTGQYVASRQDKSIYKIKVLNSKEINQRAATNIKEMLSTELNIRISHDNALGSSLKMQGLGGEHIKFLIDGVPVIGREAGNIDLEQLNLQNIDHIEVINGPMSVVYGSNALAGVINIITKEPDRLLFTSNVDAYYESVGVYNLNAGVSSSVKKHSFSLNAGRNFFDGYGKSEAGRWQQWIPKQQYTADLTYKYKWKSGFIKPAITYFDQELRDKGDLLPPYYETAFDKYYYTKRLVYRSDMHIEFSPKSRLNGTLAYSTYDKIKNTFLNNLSVLEKAIVPGQQDTTRFDNMMLRADISHGAAESNFSFVAGLDLNNERGVGERIKDKEQSIGDYAAYFSLNYSPFSTVNVQPGVRFIYNTKFAAPLIYSLNVKWDVNESLIIRGSLATGFRAPSLKELYLQFVDINHDIHGNEELKAETSNNANLFVQFNSPSGKIYEWGLEMNAFYNNIKDNIQLIPQSGNTNLYTYVNVNRFITKGIEFNFNNRIYPNLMVKFGYTITGQDIENEGYSSTGTEFYNDFSTTFNYNWRKYDINFSAYYKYNGRYPQLVYTGVEDETALSWLDPYHTLDINVNKWFWKRCVNLQVGGKNLFNNTDIPISGGGTGGGIHSGGADSQAFSWGRTFFVRLQLRFNK